LDDTLLFRTHSFEQNDSFDILRRNGKFFVECVIPPNLFPAGTYRLGFSAVLTGKTDIQDVSSALEFDVFQDELLGGRFAGTRGILTPHCIWRAADTI
jgi:hypothetical protein